MWCQVISQFSQDRKAIVVVVVSDGDVKTRISQLPWLRELQALVMHSWMFPGHVQRFEGAVKRIQNGRLSDKKHIIHIICCTTASENGHPGQRFRRNLSIEWRTSWIFKHRSTNSKWCVHHEWWCTSFEKWYLWKQIPEATTAKCPPSQE